MNKKSLAAIGLIVLAALFFSVNLASGALFRSVRFDLTEDKLFTLSEGTRNILRDMEEPVTLRFYFSRALANQETGQGISGIKDYAQRVEELLQELENYGGDKLELYVIDPEAFSKEEEDASSFGLRGATANLAGDALYFGLVGTNTTDEEEVVAFFRPERQEFLEYDVAQIIYKLSYESKTVVGLLSSLPLEGGPMNPMNPTATPPPAWLIVDELRKTFEVRTVAPTATVIDEDINVLVAVHPKALRDETLFAIDQFVLKGGRLIAFMDVWCEVDPIPRDPNNPLSEVSADRTSSLGPLLASWGVELVAEKIAGDKGSAMNIPYAGGRVDYVVALELLQDRMNAEDQVSADLKRIRMVTPGILRATEGATTSLTPLIETTEDSMEIDRITVAIGANPPQLYADFVSSGKPMALAARITGLAKSAFPDGDPAATPPPAPEEGEETPDSTSDSTQEGNINLILVADADMLADQLWTQRLRGLPFAMPNANNADFLINMVDNMSGSDDLISLRSRPSFGRPFEVVADLRRDAEEEFRAKEQALQSKLTEIDRTLQKMRSQQDDSLSSRQLLPPEQLAEYMKAKEEKIATRKELREVKHSLRKEIDKLGFKTKAINIAYIPFGLALLALLGFLLRAAGKKA